MANKNAHAALIEDGIVRQVIVIPHLNDDDAKITAYCNRIGLAGIWVDTSYTGSRRGKYAGVGDSFDVKARSGEGEFVRPHRNRRHRNPREAIHDDATDAIVEQPKEEHDANPDL